VEVVCLLFLFLAHALCVPHVATGSNAAP
jgi:hypothetical protein